VRTQEDPGKILENLGSCILSSSCVLCVVYLVFNILDFSNLVLKQDSSAVVLFVVL
jgi:hypothetical protein